MNNPCTHQIVQEAMRIVSVDVRLPKCIRDGLVKPIKNQHMNELEIEASKYAEECCNGQFPITYERWEVVNHTKNDYKEGANSKYVERQKLQFAIQQLELLREIEHSDNFWYLENKILELRESLAKI
jgi:hypothetical protein